MRHLERTHGISITSLHEHFSKDHFVLMCEITAKMAADIHTKSFTNPLAWKKACMLINLLEPEDLGSKQLADLVQPTTDVDTTVRQVFQSRTDEVSNFPYTETPMLPPEVYRKGLSSREKLQELPGMDPIFVVKTPTLFRTRPAGVKLPADCLRSTWILVHGKWEQVEDRVPPLLQQSRFDKWIERACFEYHHPTSAPIVSLPVCVSTAASSRFQRTSTSELSNPSVTFSTEILFEQAQRPQKIPFSLYEGNPMTIRVINALVRLVHGGRGTEDSKQFKDQKQFNKALSEMLKLQKPPIRRRNTKKIASATECGHDEVPVRDEWKWIGDHVLERIHNIPRREMFVPSDCDDCPCDHRLIQDWRETQLKFQSNVRVDKSNWRLPGNNGERSNNRNEFWAGKSIFRVLRHQEVLPVASCVMDDKLMACVNTMGLNIISPDKIFIPHTYRMVIEENKNKNELNIFADSLTNLVLVRDNGHCMKYTFTRSIHDLDNTKYLGKNVTITMQELPESTPTMILMCAEPSSLMTKRYREIMDTSFHLEMITEDDDLLSRYGSAKWRRCLRSNKDSVFFAGPCTGGSPWNRLNKRVSTATAHMIHAKARLYWKLWEEFSNCLLRVTKLDAMALLELPRGCDYWHDERMKCMIDGTESHTHDFDGCMYGLTTQFGGHHTPIKKPWIIVSWGVKFDLHKRCDRRHDHGKCEGRETKVTQTYTKQIVDQNSVSTYVYSVQEVVVRCG